MLDEFSTLRRLEILEKSLAFLAGGGASSHRKGSAIGEFL